jgi:hypothetical protein
VVRDRLYLCGHEPVDPEREPGAREEMVDYLPAAFSDELLMMEPTAPQREVARRWAVYNRSPLGDLQTLCRVLAGRFFVFLSSDTGSGPHA